MVFSSDRADIMTTQCEAYEVMKLQDKPTRGENVMATEPEQVYEEVREGLTLRRGPIAGATPTQRMYEEVREFTADPKAVATPSERKPTQQPRYEEPSEVTHEKDGKQFSTQQEAETLQL